MAKKKPQKVPVTERALIQRINRKLKPENELLRTARGCWDGPNWVPDSNLGRHYTIDVSKNFIVHTWVDLESYARKLDVLADWEALQAD